MTSLTEQFENSPEERKKLLLFRIKRFFCDPFTEKRLPRVPWTAKDGLMIVLLSTFLFIGIVFGGFFLGAKLFDMGIIDFYDTVEQLDQEWNLALGADKILELRGTDSEIFGGFEIMSLILMRHLGIFVVGGIILQVLLQAGMLLLYSWKKYGVILPQLGFRKVSPKMLLGMGVGLFIFGALIQNIYFAILSGAGIEQAAEGGAAEQMIMQGVVPLWILFIFAGVVAPVLEEVIFRGFFLTGSIRKYGVFMALVVSAIFFALAHINPSSFFVDPSTGGAGIRLPDMSEWGSMFLLMPIYFSLGIVLGFAFLRSKSLYPGVLFHMINNNTALVLLLLKISSLESPDVG